MIELKCYYEDGDITFTNINCSLLEAKDYYIGKYFNFGIENDIMKKCVSVEQILN